MERAEELHKSLIVIDGHCDTALDLAGMSFTDPNMEKRDFFRESDEGHLDLPKLRKGGVTCQTMAVYTPDELVERSYEHTIRISNHIDGLYNDDVMPALCGMDIRTAKRENKTALLKSLEGSDAMGTSLETLKELYDRGFRMSGLTYNRINALGRGCGTPGTSGLTPFGKRVVAEMAKLGMIVDVSHLSDEGLEDLIDITERPVVASHSNSREVENHRRNLTDRQLEAIAGTDGLIGLTYPGIFIHSDPAKVTFERLMEHLDHMLSVVGPRHIGLGSDFDGFTAPYGVCMSSCAETGKITEHLVGRGWKDNEVAMIMGENWLRIIDEVVG